MNRTEENKRLGRINKELNKEEKHSLDEIRKIKKRKPVNVHSFKDTCLFNSNKIDSYNE